MKTKLKIAQLQMRVHVEKDDTEKHLRELMKNFADGSVDVVALPEMFCCPYITSKFPEYAEPAGGRIWQLCSDLAAEYKIYLMAGTIPELEPETGNIYNTAFVFDREGKQIARHRKMHLFDINLPGGRTFKESDTLSAGNEVTVFDTEFGKMGMVVCYDIRFPELFRIMSLEGAQIIYIPAGFNMTSGPVHWEMLMRSQAVSNQLFTVGTSVCRDPEMPYVSWGHSMTVDPWGNILSEMDEKEGIIISEIDLEMIPKIREQLPLLKHRRTDLYHVALNDR